MKIILILLYVKLNFINFYLFLLKDKLNFDLFIYFKNSIITEII